MASSYTGYTEGLLYASERGRRGSSVQDDELRIETHVAHGPGIRPCRDCCWALLFVLCFCGALSNGSVALEKALEFRVRDLSSPSPSAVPPLSAGQGRGNTMELPCLASPCPHALSLRELLTL